MLTKLLKDVSTRATIAGLVLSFSIVGSLSFLLLLLAADYLGITNVVAFAITWFFLTVGIFWGSYKLRGDSKLNSTRQDK